MSDAKSPSGARGLDQLVRDRHSERVPFNPDRALSESDLRAILEAARWAPTAHNMQNFEIIVVDDKATLAEIGAVRSGVSPEFVAENYAQLSFSEEELIQRKTGLLATSFPPSWRHPPGMGFAEATDEDLDYGFLDATMRSAPVVLIVVYDVRKRAPASEHDFLGNVSLGCVLENMWLTAESLGIGLQMMSVFSAKHAEFELRRILSIPGDFEIAYACRLGYPLEEPPAYLRVRRGVEDFTHRNTFASPEE